MAVRARLRTIAILLLAVAGAALTTWLLFGPKTLNIAVGPMASADARLVVSFLQTLKRERASVRLRLVLTESPAASAAAFAEGKADLAVVLSDAPLPEAAATVAVLRRDAAFFVTKPGTGIEKISDLRGRTVGMVKERPAYSFTYDQVLSHYGLTLDAVTVMSGTQSEILQAARDGQLDAIFVVAPQAERSARAAYQAFQREGAGAPGLLPIAAAAAIVAQEPMLDTVELVPGLLSADPAVPEEATTTLATAHRLIARRSLDEATISELTRLLVTLRLVIAAEAPIAKEIELPTTEDRASKLPVHPGTIAYIEGETKTFFERYGDWIYIGIMGASVIGSALTAAYASLTNRRPVVDIKRELGELVELIAAAREAKSAADLEVLTADGERIRADLVSAIVGSEPDGDGIAAMRFLLDEYRTIMAERRAVLAKPGELAIDRLAG